MSTQTYFGESSFVERPQWTHQPLWLQYWSIGKFIVHSANHMPINAKPMDSDQDVILDISQKRLTRALGDDA